MTSPANAGPTRAFEKIYQIRHFELDREHRLTPISLFNYLTETAISHSESLGRGPLAIAAHGFTWFLVRFHIQIDRYPRLGEELAVRTWPASLRGLYARREFVITAGGVVCCRATTRWVLINIARRRPVRLPPYISEAYEIFKQCAVDDSFEKIAPLGTPTISKAFHVRLSDLDPNHHATSAAYVDWCLEAVPREVHEAMLPVEIEVVFEKESTLGETLLSESCPCDAASQAEAEADADPGADDKADAEPNSGPSFLHQIQARESGLVLARGTSRWRSQSEA